MAEGWTAEAAVYDGTRWVVTIRDHRGQHISTAYGDTESKAVIKAHQIIARAPKSDRHPADRPEHWGDF